MIAILHRIGLAVALGAGTAFAGLAVGLVASVSLAVLEWGLAAAGIATVDPTRIWTVGPMAYTLNFALVAGAAALLARLAMAGLPVGATLLAGFAVALFVCTAWSICGMALPGPDGPEAVCRALDAALFAMHPEPGR